MIKTLKARLRTMRTEKVKIKKLIQGRKIQPEAEEKP